jgi:hypothetical protein
MFHVNPPGDIFQGICNVGWCKQVSLFPPKYVQTCLMALRFGRRKIYLVRQVDINEEEKRGKNVAKEEL